MLEEPVETRLYLSLPSPDFMQDAALAEALAAGVASVSVDVSDFVEAQAQALERMQAVADRAECPLIAAATDAAQALEIAKRFSLDGVHLSGAPKQVAWARRQIGADAIVGFGAGLSRQDGLIAAENGADYVMFAPLADVEPDLLVWWQAVIETPVIAGGIATTEELAAIKGIVDFAGIVPGEAPIELVRQAVSALAA